MRLRAAGVNPVDAYIRSGAYARKPPLPYTPGSDGAGEIEAVGADVKDCRGRRSRVHPRHGRRHTHGHYGGAYAEQARLHASTSIYRLPARVSFAQGAAMGVPYATAYRALFQRAGTRPGETVLVHGATGGVGIAAVQLAHAHGMTVIGTGGTDARPDGRARARRRRRRSTTRRPATSTTSCARPAGAASTSILEMAAHVNLDKDLGLLAKHGRVVVVGNRGRVEIDARQAMGRDAAILGHDAVQRQRPDMASINALLVAGLANGTLNPVVGREFPLADAAQAHEAVMEPGALGKIVLVP